MVCIKPTSVRTRRPNFPNPFTIKEITDLQLVDGSFINTPQTFKWAFDMRIFFIKVWTEKIFFFIRRQIISFPVIISHSGSLWYTTSSVCQLDTLYHGYHRCKIDMYVFYKGHRYSLQFTGMVRQHVLSSQFAEQAWMPLLRQ